MYLTIVVHHSRMHQVNTDSRTDLSSHVALSSAGFRLHVCRSLVASCVASSFTDSHAHARRSSTLLSAVPSGHSSSPFLACAGLLHAHLHISRPTPPSWCAISIESASRHSRRSRRRGAGAFLAYSDLGLHTIERDTEAARGGGHAGHRGSGKRHVGGLSRRSRKDCPKEISSPLTRGFVIIETDILGLILHFFVIIHDTGNCEGLRNDGEAFIRLSFALIRDRLINHHICIFMCSIGQRSVSQRPRA
jgi:hypothetical protein